MTKKDYIKFAAMLAGERKIEVPAGYIAWERYRDRIAEILADDNPRFDRARFYAATEKKE